MLTESVSSVREEAQLVLLSVSAAFSLPILMSLSTSHQAVRSELRGS